MESRSPSWFVLSSKATADICYEALIPAVTFTAFAILVVGLRWYSRVYSTAGSIGTEDYLVTCALMLSICITGVVGGEFNVGGHTGHDEAHLSSLSTMLKLLFTQSILYHLSINLVKISFALQYLRLFAVVPPIVHACYILLVLISGAAAWGIFGVIFLCSPVQSYWNIAVTENCINTEKHFCSTSIIGIALDCAIWLLPIPVVRSLRLPRRQKLGLLVVFGLGGFVCIVSMLRLVLVYEAAKQDEITKSGTYAIIFSTIEVNVAIICASLLVMKPLFARFLPAFVFEPAVSAREDRQLWRGLTGLDLLYGLPVEDEEKHGEGEGGGDCERRDTAISMGRSVGRVAVAQNVWDPGRRRRSF